MRLLVLAAAVLLARAPAPEVCGALNVTVSPGPVVDYLEGENATLLCHVSQKRRKDSLLAVRWFFARPDSQEALMVKMTKLRVVQYYGNFSRSAYRQRLRLLEERRGVLYTLSVLTLRPADQGHYVCKVQEISKHRNKWTAWSNGSSATEMRVISLKASEDSSFEKKKETWAFFEDLYVYAVLVCCVGILSVLLFTLTIIWQSVFSKRKSRVRHYLVKCPQNSVCPGKAPRTGISGVGEGYGSGDQRLWRGQPASISQDLHAVILESGLTFLASSAGVWAPLPSIPRPSPSVAPIQSWC
ncbi:V-set and transmembrane domain-containing protein 4 isoform X2 [Balaenoptera acutorostrata]|uniref:V-set and transmembrane domain-containing protein 4 isoform X2 n=1 Tax=Balaenoptera acutorostrata TaxID=9767 RepID=A0ABM3SC40_BALAC|nr:V-set and transmembrane domain-containing protein 4 isoform X2 [Balaenoptera acutorostrata]